MRILQYLVVVPLGSSLVPETESVAIGNQLGCLSRHIYEVAECSTLQSKHQPSYCLPPIWVFPDLSVHREDRPLQLQCISCGVKTTPLSNATNLVDFTARVLQHSFTSTSNSSAAEHTLKLRSF